MLYDVIENLTIFQIIKLHLNHIIRFNILSCYKITIEKSIRLNTVIVWYDLSAVIHFFQNINH